MRNSVSYEIMSAQGLSTANFTAATTDIITSNAHGLLNGDRVVLTTTNTLPAGLSTGTVYYVIEKTTNTFKLAATPEGPAIDITDTGTGTHTFTEHDIGKNIFCADFRHIKLEIGTSNNANLTFKVVGSDSEDCPDFSAAKSVSNNWEYIGVIDREDGSPIDGDTGISFAGTDDYRQLTVNADGLRWVNIIITAWSAGDITAKATLYTN